MSEQSSPSLPAAATVSAECRLLVPMRLQALAVTDPESVHWADLTPRYDLLDADEPATLGYQIRPNFFDDPREPPGAGIHLHWSLPETFTHIDQEPGKGASFRGVPNRWLVVRLWRKAARRLAHRAWIVDSDYLGMEADGGTNPWLTLSGAGSTRRFDAQYRLGRVLDLQDFKERGGPSSLTAVAPGNLAFSNFYPSCRHVFGFYDQPEDLQKDTVYCYVVVGWFADPGADPLFGCKDKDAWLARMGRLGWSVPDGTTMLPTRTLCHGTIQGVEWEPPDSQRVLAFPQFEIAIGNSAPDAIAAFVDRTTTSQVAARRRLLGQLQFAVLQDRPPTATELYLNTFSSRDRLTALRARLHQRMFTALPGGTRWEIDRPARSSEQAARQARAVLQLPDALAEKLRNLNRDQREYDRQQRHLAGLQRDLYAEWHKRRLVTYIRLPDQRERRQRENALDRRIGALTPLVEQFRRSIASLKAGIDSAADEIRQNPEWREHVLIERPMPRYWRANDPVLLMAGVPIPTIQGGAAPLSCRVSGQTVSSLYVDNVPNYGAANVGVDYLKDQIAAIEELSAETPLAVRSDFPELLCEALLLDPRTADLLAQIAYVKQKGFTPTPAQIAALGEPLRNAQRGRYSGNFHIGVQRATDGAALTAFRSALSATATAPSPWTPVFMVWETQYRPACLDRRDALELWDLDDGALDYGWRGPAGSVAAAAVNYQGYVPLGDTVGRGLAKGQEPFPWKVQYPEDGFVFDVLGASSRPQDTTRKSLVVQSLGGLTEALIQQDATIQLPPLHDKSLEIDEEMSRLVGAHYAVAPLPRLLNGSLFFPIRGGDLDIARLRLVDTFGRTRRVVEAIEDRDDNAPPPKVYISRSLAVSGSTDSLRLRLPPRLVQPSRLMFRWLSAVDDAQEFLGDRATQPVCGWILPNRLDHSLMICDAAGRALGAVQSVIRHGGHDNRGIRWSKLPPAAIDPAADLQMPRPSARDIPNHHLLGFVNGLLDLADDAGKCRTRAFEDLLDLIAEIAESDRRSPEQRDLSVLVGQPLALVRASLNLDLMGPPATDQSWSQLAAHASTGFTQVEFGVRLGDRRRGPDGLIGCFLPAPDEDKTNYGTLHLSQDVAPETGARTDVYFRHRDAVRVTCDPASAPILLTLLVDPRSGVHISSGILPTKVIDLPSELVSAALSQLEVPFLVAPVLGEKREDGVPDIPLPTDMAGIWTWTWLSAANAKAKCTPIAPETAPARSLFRTMALYEGWLSLRQKGTDGS